MSRKISVLIPTYNRVYLIANCLNSIVKQTYTNLEIIVYDDGSTDNTENVVKSFKDDRIRYYKCKTNKGVSYARNKLLELVNTMYACWQDSDDMSNIYRIEKQYDVIVRNSRSFVSTNHVRLTSQNRKECFQVPMIRFGDRGRSFGSVMFETINVPKFIEGVDYGGEDVEWIRELKLLGLKHINLPERLLYISLMNNDRIGNLKNKYRKEKKKSDEKRRRYWISRDG